MEGERGDWLKRRAKDMRAEMTPHEKIVWRLLHQGELVAFNWRTQAPFGAFILDFVSHPARLVVEVDGAQHADAKIVEADSDRTEWLKGQGYQVLRFWNFETVQKQDGVWRTIYDAALQTRAAPRMTRWRANHMREIAEVNARLPLNGGGGREAAGGGARADSEGNASRGSTESTSGPHPLSHAARDSSPIAGERGAQPGEHL